jgi:hypothetical protein
MTESASSATMVMVAPTDANANSQQLVSIWGGRGLKLQMYSISEDRSRADDFVAVARRPRCDED